MVLNHALRSPVSPPRGPMGHNVGLVLLRSPVRYASLAPLAAVARYMRATSSRPAAVARSAQSSRCAQHARGKRPSAGSPWSDGPTHKPCCRERSYIYWAPRGVHNPETLKTWQRFSNLFNLFIGKIPNHFACAHLHEFCVFCFTPRV